MGEVSSDRSHLKQQLKREAKKLGANLIGFANVERWEEYRYTQPEYYPQSIWPWAKTVIVMAVQIFPSMIETTPSVLYSELYNTTNRMLDEIGYRMANLLNTLGFRAHFFPRDCYGDISVLVKKPEAPFSHVIAGYYAGLGTIGMNHALLAKEYGPRIRLVSVITDAEVAPDKMIEKDICIRCGQCVKGCPIQAFTPRNDRIAADMNKHKYRCYERQRYPFPRRI